MSTIKVLTVVGARPQFIKAAAVSRAIAEFNAGDFGVEILEQIVHTGQHYDANLSQVFFDELGIPSPTHNLGVGSGPHGKQTARMLDKLSKVLSTAHPDVVLVYGDTNSTLAGALAASQLNIPVAHVEAGLRSYDRRIVEEVNRVVADYVSSLLFCPSLTGVQNLAREGITEGVYLTGDVMYDAFLHYGEKALRCSDALSRFGVEPKKYYLATVHRAENTQDVEVLRGIMAALQALRFPVLLPLHPRTRKVLEENPSIYTDGLIIVKPVSYLSILTLQMECRLIVTDSGGIQKEAYWSGVPCVTMTDTDEWVELSQSGCNTVVGPHREQIIEAVEVYERRGLTLDAPPDLYGRGDSADRVVQLLVGV